MGTWTRRAFLGAVGSAALAPRLARAQPSERVHRICWPNIGSPRTESYNVAFIERLRELGYIEGRNLTVDFRTAGGRSDKLPGLAADMARQPCDLFIAPGGEAALVAAKNATRDTPIVMVANDYDPVATGHVASLAQPGGRITGVTQLQSELPPKRLELLKELLPKARRITILSDAATGGQLATAQPAAERLGLVLHVVQFKTAPYDYERAFAESVRAKSDAVLALTSGAFVPARRQIPALALQHRLPSVFGNVAWVEAGALLSYGPNFSDLYRLAADKAALLLKGTKPTDIPVEQPTRLELVVNLKTAKALSLTIPQSIRLRADRLIE